MRLLRSLRLILSADAAQAEKLFENTLERIDDSAEALKEAAPGQIAIAAAATVSLPFGGVTKANLLLLVSNKALKVSFNGGVEQFDLKLSGTNRALALWEGGEFTSVQLENPGAEEATVLYALAGV